MQEASLSPTITRFFPFAQQCICSSVVEFSGPVKGFANVNFRAKSIPVISTDAIVQMEHLFESYVPLLIVLFTLNNDIVNARLNTFKTMSRQSPEDRLPKFGKPHDTRSFGESPSSKPFKFGDDDRQKKTQKPEFNSLFLLMERRYDTRLMAENKFACVMCVHHHTVHVMYERQDRCIHEDRHG